MPTFHMTVGRWLIVVAIIAVGLVHVALGVFVFVFVLAGLALLCLAARPINPDSARWAKSYLLTIACLYLPYGWLIVQDYPWNSYHWYWIRLWPVLPGLLGGLLIHPIEETAERMVMAAITVVMIAGFSSLGSLSRSARIGMSAVAFVGSCVLSYVAYSVFVM